MRVDCTCDVLVLGAGPAGLSAALWLARLRRAVVVLHDGTPRNRHAVALHGYLGVEDPAPQDLLRRGQGQARRAGAVLLRGRAEGVSRRGAAFVVRARTPRRTVRLRARALLVSTGIEDAIPAWARPHYGAAVHHCPDCDGPQYTGRDVVAVGPGPGLWAYAQHLLRWARHLHVVSPSRASRAHLLRRVTFHRGEVSRIAKTRGHELTVELTDGTDIACAGAFFQTRPRPRLEAVRDLRLATRADGLLRVDRTGATDRPGVFGAGDVTHGSQLAIVAAGEGASTAIHLHRWLEVRDASARSQR